jgi:hypothetical protein
MDTTENKNPAGEGGTLNDRKSRWGYSLAVLESVETSRHNAERMRVAKIMSKQLRAVRCGGCLHPHLFFAGDVAGDARKEDGREAKAGRATGSLPAGISFRNRQ